MIQLDNLEDMFFRWKFTVSNFYEILFTDNDYQKVYIVWSFGDTWSIEMPGTSHLQIVVACVSNWGECRRFSQRKVKQSNMLGNGQGTMERSLEGKRTSSSAWMKASKSSRSSWRITPINLSSFHTSSSLDVKVCPMCEDCASLCALWGSLPLTVAVSLMHFSRLMSFNAIWLWKIAAMTEMTLRLLLLMCCLMPDAIATTSLVSCLQLLIWTASPISYFVLSKSVTRQSSLLTYAETVEIRLLASYQQPLHALYDC